MTGGKIGVGVIGLGIGARHVETVFENPHTEVVALCDVDSSRLAEVGQRCPSALQTTEFRRVVEDSRVHLVVVASSDADHGEQVLASLRAGKHVFVEKPLCTNRADFHQIVEVLSMNPLLGLSSNLVLRTSRRYQVLRRLIRAGYFGSVNYLEADYDYGRLAKFAGSWRGSDPDYSVMLGGGIHMLDLLLWLVGEPVIDVAAMGSNASTKGLVQSGVHDTQVALLKFEGGTIAKVSSNFAIASPHFHCLKISGTEKSFVQSPAGAGYMSRDEAELVRSVAVRDDVPGARSMVLGSFIKSLALGTPAIVTQSDVIASISLALDIADVLRGT